ncbi:unnamed protein product [Closterium sp. Yama58-4]|nr:unnamed protein product [Closterium sp. Yama58-4]
MGIPVTEHRDFATTSPPHCAAVPHIWSRFVDAFVDFAVGGHVLAGRAKDSPRWTRQSGAFDPATDQSGTSNVDRAAKPEGSEASGTRDQETISVNQTESVSPGDTDGPPPLATVLPAADRVVAIGDIHGDIAKARQALRTAGLIDGQDRWTGKSTVLVQVGDLLDRGGQELAVVYLFEKLRREARQAGGAVHVLLGNHETGNFEGWFRYATREGRKDFQRWAAWERLGVGLRAACEGGRVSPDPLASVSERVRPELRARMAALSPGSPLLQRFFAGNPSVLRLGSTVFVHGGLLPEHVQYGLERINREGQEWILSPARRPDGLPERGPHFFHTKNAVVWVREYSHTDPSICDCRLLERTLEMLPGSMRMVMGHTIQQPGGINATCKGKAIRVDVGMSEGCGGAEAEVLEIRKDREVWVVRAAEEAAGKPAKAHVLAGTEVPADKHGFWGKLREAMGTRVA